VVISNTEGSAFLACSTCGTRRVTLVTNSSINSWMKVPECAADLINIRVILIMIFFYCYYNFRIICKTLRFRIEYWNKTKAYVSMLNKCYIYFRFSEISAWRQVSIQFQALTIWIHKFISWRGHDCDHILVGFTTICAISSNHVHGEVYSIQHYMIKFVSNFRRVGGFPRVLQFP